MLRSVLAVVVGFVVTAVASVATDRLVMALMPGAVSQDQSPGTGLWLLILAYCQLYAALGGYVTAFLARRAEVRHALVLGSIALLLGTAAMLPALIAGSPNPHTPPVWWTVADLGLVMPAVVLGGFLRALQRRGRSASAKHLA